MPAYVSIETKNLKEIFKNCGTPAVAGRNSNMQNELGADFSLVLSHSFDIVSQNSSSTNHFSWKFMLSVPAYAPSKSALINLMNQKEPIEKMTLIIADRNASGGKNTIKEKYIAENGSVEFVSMSDNNIGSDGYGKISIIIDFEKMMHENLVSNTSGHIQTTSH